MTTFPKQTGMLLTEYQHDAQKFIRYPREGDVRPDEYAKGVLHYRREDAVVYTTLALAGEAGEAANAVKKMIRDDAGDLTRERTEQIADELGDVLWYVAMAAMELGISLNDLAVMNLAKLEGRHG